MTKVKCPYCGYEMPLFYSATAASHGITVQCKGRHCKKKFEVVIKNGKQEVLKVEP